MDRSVASLIGAVTALAAASPSQAAAPVAHTLDAAMQVSSYADLLKPIPNALALLKESATAEARASLVTPTSEGQAAAQEAQYYHPRYYNYRQPYYHHHHHHRFYRRRYHHHHHHHHHHHFSDRLSPDRPVST